MIKAILQKRGTDQWGSGEFGAPRGDRTHNGIDFKAAAGQVILSPATGFITKIGYPYGDDLSFRYVQIEDERGYKHRLFYVLPNEIKTMRFVYTGDEIGAAQDLTNRYPGIENHIHYEIQYPDGEHINPEEFN